MTILAKPGATVRAMLRDGRGIAAAEFALIAPVMLTMLFGVYDLGNAIQQRLQLEQAVRAGGQFALSWPDQTGGIAGAIKAALPATWADATIAVGAPVCYCKSSTNGTTASPCTDTCAAGTTKQTFVTMTASNNASPFLFTALTGNSATYVVEVQ
jgi:Flp pilus assembly protein TadG